MINSLSVAPGQQKRTTKRLSIGAISAVVFIKDTSKDLLLLVAAPSLTALPARCRHALLTTHVSREARRRCSRIDHQDLGPKGDDHAINRLRGRHKPLINGLSMDQSSSMDGPFDKTQKRTCPVLGAQKRTSFELNMFRENKALTVTKRNGRHEKRPPFGSPCLKRP